LEASLATVLAAKQTAEIYLRTELSGCQGDLRSMSQRADARGLQLGRGRRRLRESYVALQQKQHQLAALQQRQGLTLVHFSAQPEPFLTRSAP